MTCVPESTASRAASSHAREISAWLSPFAVVAIVLPRIVEGRPLIGASGAEFEFSTTGKGNVEVSFILQGGPFGDEPKKEEVRFMVK